MSVSRALARPLLLIAILFVGPVVAPHAQVGGGTSGGTSGGTPGGSSSMSTSPSSPSTSPTTRTSPNGAVIPGQPGATTAAPSSDTIGNARAPSETTRGDTYDRLPDEPGPDYRISPDDPLDNNPAAAAGPQSKFPDGRAGADTGAGSEMIPDTNRATRGANPAGQAQAEAQRQQIRKQKERTEVDTLSECMEAWDPQTHIGKDEWKKTCARTLTEPHL
jgi:hypothetical protein